MLQLFYLPAAIELHHETGLAWDEILLVVIGLAFLVALALVLFYGRRFKAELDPDRRSGQQGANEETGG